MDFLRFPGLALLAALLQAGGVHAGYAIVGGKPVPKGKLAFLAEIDNTDTRIMCSGALIDPDWVLTAAHCVPAGSLAGQVVRIGNLADNRRGQLRRVVRILRTPGYVPTRSGYVHDYDDLALLELQSPVTAVLPVPLAGPEDAALWDGVGGDLETGYDPAIAVGWGETKPGSSPAWRPRFRNVFIKPSATDDAGFKEIITTAGTCGGDSGGPLLVTSGDNYVEAGVDAGETGHCRKASLYSEVGAGRNHDWLASQLPKSPFSIAGIGDWDRDGNQDVIARNDMTGDLYLYPGKRDHADATDTRIKIGTGWQGVTFAGIADWDGDGNPDVIARDDTDGLLLLYPGEGRRDFSSAPPIEIGSGWYSYTFFGITDWDGDGHQDIIARNDLTGDLMLFPGESVRGLSNEAPVTIAKGWNVYSPFGVGDWNHDGKPDLIVRDNDTGDLLLFPGPGTREPLKTDPIKIGKGWQGRTAAGLADWDGDGNLDILERNESTGTLLVHPGDGRPDGNQKPPVALIQSW